MYSDLFFFSFQENVTLVEPFDANSNVSGDENLRPLWPPTVPDSVGPEEHETIMRSILYPPPDTQIGGIDVCVRVCVCVCACV
jgi:hypothetical protein